MIGKCKGTVLLVDDEASIRMVVARVLEANGYRVLLALSGEEAIELWKAYSSEIDLLFTDLQMPGMSGVELAEELKRTRPDLKVLFTSGSGISVVEAMLNSTQAGAFLPKPYRMPALGRAVQNALNSK
jgi:CheY-like chemotaxis protein